MNRLLSLLLKIFASSFPTYNIVRRIFSSIISTCKERTERMERKREHCWCICVVLL